MYINKNIKNIFLLLLTITVVSCSSDNESVPQVRTYEEVKADFEKLTFSPGINDMEIEGTFDNVIWRFRVIIPLDASSTNKRPLIVALHGGATIINVDLHKNTACLTEPGFEDWDAFILAPNSDGFIWYDVPNQDKVITLTKLLKEFLNVNKNKIAITGYSDGGNGAWYFSQYYPQEFSASIPMASSYNPVRRGLPSSKIDIPMYVIHGANDQLFTLPITQGYVDETINAGTDLKFVIANGLEHYNSCFYVPYLKDAATWLDTVVW